MLITKLNPQNQDFAESEGSGGKAKNTFRKRASIPRADFYPILQAARSDLQTKTICGKYNIGLSSTLLKKVLASLWAGAPTIY